MIHEILFLKDKIEGWNLLDKVKRPPHLRGSLFCKVRFKN